jgi:hypothetical protein
MRTLAEALDQRVLLTDGAMARQLRALDVDVERDLFGAADCIEILNLTRAALVRSLHEAYLRAGADVVRTNSLGGSPLSLGRFGLGEHAFAVNYTAAQLACEAVDTVPGHGRRRFVLGVVRDFGWDMAPKEIETAVAAQVEGLIAGGVDGVALDIMPGAGRAPAFLRGARRAKEAMRTSAAIFLQRGHGGAEFSDHLRKLADGVIRYRHGKADDQAWLATALHQDQANLIGGGETPRETAELDRRLRTEAEDGLRPLVAWAVKPAFEEAVPPSSLSHFEEAEDKITVA